MYPFEVKMYPFVLTQLWLFFKRDSANLTVTYFDKTAILNNIKTSILFTHCKQQLLQN